MSTPIKYKQVFGSWAYSSHSFNELNHVYGEFLRKNLNAGTDQVVNTQFQQTVVTEQVYRDTSRSYIVYALIVTYSKQVVVEDEQPVDFNSNPDSVWRD